ncbi:hypothetical protein V8B55DRAFT_1435503 [Mucor lusitanicus]|uniref:Uncharacterized protein n=1 Tax=Mucor lusitanicus CBS 277.49 TaxID=747725 RepID=A0A168GIG8_MUCCL|nr:hypothetical protein MUCCIDRAFT_116204 [Mucor lusitanicus CBS 277.49]
MASTHETRNRDNEKFKLGQFDAFEEAYMRAIDILFLNIEKYNDALATYDRWLKYKDGGNPKMNQGMSRCRQALNPKKKAPSTPKKLAKPAAEAKNNDFMSMFGPNTPFTINTPTVFNLELTKSKTVVAMRAKAAEQEAEDAKKLEKTDDANAILIA